MKSLRILPAVALLVAACGGQETPAVPASVADAEQLAAQAPAAAPPPAAAPVNVCAMLGRADVEAVLGALSEDPAAQPPQGSLLGQCDYSGSKGFASVSARPAHEFKDTVAYSSEKGGGTPAAGLPAEAVVTAHGVMMQPPGRPYFLVVFTLSSPDFKFDEAAAVALARKINL